ncbi:MAG: ImmA/IrrE family metallo-endopeptidase [Deltaproteobacteria bacterium]|jgi:Zn-dependent peptidase ImmA (M78 family)|nr:ImmA/IrrE family metallo-endopeptidase [Deltaproteobacteria bacterium]
MKYPKISIDLSRFNWAIENSDVDKKTIFDIFPKLGDWISGNDKPTMRELSDFSLKTHIPIGYFFLKNPPKEEHIELLKYRTIQSHKSSTISKNLRDTVLQMTNIQDWMRKYFITYEKAQNSFVASLKNVTSVELMSNFIRNNLNIEVDWFTKNSDPSKNFKFLRSKIQKLNIIVMMNGIVGSNTKRSLNIEEFRAFTMIDYYAPLIFINAKDSSTGRIFSLMHELTHVAIGENSLFNAGINSDIQSCGDIEKICNAVAAEILIPIELFKDQWEKNKNEVNEQKIISNLASHFKVSKIAIARRAYDQKLIIKDVYNFYDNKTPNINEPKKSKGGNSYKTFLSRFDENFLKIINKCVRTGYLLYTDAYGLTGVNRTFFDNVMNKLNTLD